MQTTGADLFFIYPGLPRWSPHIQGRFYCRRAHGDASKDPKQIEKQLDALTWKKGMSDYDLKSDEDPTLQGDAQATIKSITLEPLTAGMDVDKPHIGFGRRYELTVKPLGLLKIEFTSNPAWPDGTISEASISPYAVIHCVYYLLTSKSTDLG